MKKFNILLFFTFLLITGGFLSSCQKDELLKQEPNLSNSEKSVIVNCDECVPTWPETMITFDATSFVPQGPNVSPPTNLYLDVYNDATTVYYRLYRLNGATFTYLSFNGSILLNHVSPAVTEWSWTTPLPVDWAACDQLTKLIIVGGLDIHDAHFNGNICYTFRDICENVECTSETAWAFGPRYTLRGNWATYTPYVANSTVTIFAGQTINVGTAHFSAVAGGMVTITINLTGGWHFDGVSENLKIQGYASPPSGNPAPGQFANKFTISGNTASVSVPAANYYGVHLDTEHCE